jgi:hypothetical protein
VTDTNRKTINVPYGMTVGALRDKLSLIPIEATIDVEVSAGDRPWESSEKRIVATWPDPPEGGESHGD